MSSSSIYSLKVAKGEKAVVVVNLPYKLLVFDEWLAKFFGFSWYESFKSLIYSQTSWAQLISKL